MFSIGDFARLGRVSIRMLRHYDAIGLLRPSRVDPDTGYRFYNVEQLQRLNRIVALKDLGFTLQQVQAILDELVTAEELRGMLRLRRAELEAQIAADTSRLARVEARLRMIERESSMDTDGIVVKHVPPVRVAELTGMAASYAPEDISPVIQPLYPELARRLRAAGIVPEGGPIAWYEPASEGTGERVTVHAGWPVALVHRPGYDFAIVDLPAIPSAATLIHRGSMDDVDGTIQTLARWIAGNGYRTDGYAREVYLECPLDAPADWVTELQLAVTR
jgi:DNA-binding transcriptional MerR regulator/effector-binding domain-containing protein